MKKILNYSLKISKINLLLILIGLSLILISGLRPVGIDWDSETYVNYLNMPIKQLIKLKLEPFFLFLSYLTQILFHGNTTFFFLIFATIGVSVKLYAIKKMSSFPLISTFLYICLYFVLHEMTQIRAGVAAGIFLLAIPDIVNRNCKQYFFKILFASLFHYSAIATILFYFLNPKKFNQILYFTLVIIGVLICCFFQNIILNTLTLIANFFPENICYKLNVYLQFLKAGKFANMNFFNIFHISNILIYLFLVINYFRIKSNQDIIMLKIFGWMLFIFYGFSAIPVLAFRLSELLGIILIILFANMLNIFKQKYIIAFFLIAYMLLYFIEIMLIRNLQLEMFFS